MDKDDELVNTEIAGLKDDIQELKDDLAAEQAKNKELEDINKHQSEKIESIQGLIKDLVKDVERELRD